MEDHHRKNDAMLADLNRGFKDFEERYERDQEVAQQWRNGFEKKVTCLQKSVDKMMIPYRIVVWTLGGGLVTFAGIVIHKIAEWVQSHIV